MRFPKVIAVAALLLAGCSFLTLAQTELAKYKLEASASGQAYLAGNAKFLVYHGKANAWAKLRGPLTYGAEETVLWEWAWSPDNQHGVYQIIVPSSKGEKFQLVESTWEAARTSLTFLSEDPPWEDD